MNKPMLKRWEFLDFTGNSLFCYGHREKINIIFIPIILTDRANCVIINIPYGDAQKGAENGNRKEQKQKNGDYLCL